MPTGVYIRSEETRRKMSLNKIGVKNPMNNPETRMKMIASKKGKPSPLKGIKTGIIPWNKGKKIPEEIRIRMRGRKLSAEHRKKISELKKGKPTPWMVGRTISIETRKKISNSVRKIVKRGKDCNLYIDGGTKLRFSIRDSIEYREWRNSIFKRDNFTCSDCGVYNGYLEPHHIIRYIDIVKKYNITTKDEAILCKELWDINNGVTLCRKCHCNRHKKI